jgi:hypothetical protein
MVEGMELKLLHRGALEWHHPPTKYYENLPNGSNVINGTHTQADRLVI